MEWRNIEGILDWKDEVIKMTHRCGSKWCQFKVPRLPVRRSIVIRGAFVLSLSSNLTFIVMCLVWLLVELKEWEKETALLTDTHAKDTQSMFK